MFVETGNVFELLETIFCHAGGNSIAGVLPECFCEGFCFEGVEKDEKMDC